VKNVFRLAAMAVLMLLSIPSVFAQPNCDSSFSFIKTDNATLDIIATGGHTLNELYDTSVGFTWEAWVYLDDTSNTPTILMAVGDSVLYEDIFIGMGWNGPGSNAIPSVRVSANMMGPTVSSHKRYTAHASEMVLYHCNLRLWHQHTIDLR
jgi:hypothetical protein